MLLEPEFLARLERLSLTTRERLSGSFPGEHRSRRLGTSVDFADWREYVPGDDFRRIDYQILARLDKLLVRLYEAEDEINLQIVLDASASMDFEGKFDAACRLAGSLAYLAALHGDRARVWIADESGLHASPWARSRDSSIVLFKWIERARPAGSSDLPGALRRLASFGATGSVVVLVSDLLTEKWEEALRRLGGPGAEAALLHVLSRAELDPPLRGDLRLVDSEADGSVEVSVSDQVLKRYKERTAAWVQGVSETCRRRGVRYALVTPDDDLEALLLVKLREDGLVK